MAHASILDLHDAAIHAHSAGNTPEALTLLQQALSLNPRHTQVLITYAQILRANKQPLKALDSFLHALTLDPENAAIANAVGVCFEETHQPAKAIEYYLRALALDPNFAEPYNNIAVIQLHEKNPTAAIEHLHQALALQPDYAAAINNLALAHRELHEYRAARAFFERALTLQPDNPSILAGFGELLGLLYEPAAETHLRRAAALAPHDPELRWNLALQLLKQGNYPEGFACYESRWERPSNQTPLRAFPQPFWRGEPNIGLNGKTILVHTEQGFGDTLQFLRYIPLLLDRGANVLLEVQPELTSLISQWAATTNGRVTVLANQKPPATPAQLPSFDIHTALMSLPHAFASTVTTIPPPLRLTPAKTCHPEPGAPCPDSRTWVSDDSDRTKRIGLCWAGNPNHTRDRERSIPLGELLPLFTLPHLEWVSLQLNADPDPIASVGIRMQHPPLPDFTATAAVIDTLDLVLTVDTAIAHLAASQGAPTWLLIPWVADWRWLAPTHTGPNPWYPDLRIFRPSGPPPEGNPHAAWPHLVAEVAAALSELTA